MAHPRITFPKPSAADFYNTARKRVHEYFKTNNIKIHANSQMVVKTIFMLSLYFVPYVLMVAGVVTNFWAILLMWVLMGVGMAGIGLSVMHDANHGAYSRKKKVNDYIGKVIWLIGGSAVNWKIQHNVLHHSYTNVDEFDEDIDPVSILRFSPHAELKKIHRMQHWYAWFLYGLMTLLWATFKDFNQLNRYKREDLIKTQSRSYKSLMTELIIVKIAYYAFIIAIPMLTLPVAWYWVIVFFLAMHFVAGLILAMIFQPAHVMPYTEFPLPDDQGNMENKWAIHQLLTTVNFAPKSRVFSWYVGGLNFQIEHHLFPNICHVHYKKISKIVRETATEFNLPYYSEPTFFAALSQHMKFLKKLGRA
ncbi:MAG: acyl-CoA desaturase [Bacteroidetes bacterium]|nr:acyl-CoA desaturase [Bacteroidota bacterium]